MLALGCQYNGYSSFIPEDSHAWKLFQTALTRLDRILMTAESLPNLQVSYLYYIVYLLTVQALTAMVCSAFAVCGAS